MSINMEFCLFVLRFETYIGDEAKTNDSRLTIEQGDATTSKVVRMLKVLKSFKLKNNLWHVEFNMHLLPKTNAFGCHSTN
jgi:hypothetical protein